MGKEANTLFTVSVRTSFWTLEEHKPLIVAFLLPVISRRN